jgi:cold shock protein
MSKLNGIVKFYNSSKGFGFLKENGTETEVFVHATGLIDEIRENDQVEYEVTQGKKGLNAINVKVIE